MANYLEEIHTNRREFLVLSGALLGLLVQEQTASAETESLAGSRSPLLSLQEDGTWFPIPGAEIRTQQEFGPDRTDNVQNYIFLTLPNPADLQFPEGKDYVVIGTPRDPEYPQSLHFLSRNGVTQRVFVEGGYGEVVEGRLIIDPHWLGKYTLTHPVNAHEVVALDTYTQLAPPVNPDHNDESLAHITLRMNREGQLLPVELLAGQSYSLFFHYNGADFVNELGDKRLQWDEAGKLELTSSIDAFTSGNMFATVDVSDGEKELDLTPGTVVYIFEKEEPDTTDRKQATQIKVVDESGTVPFSTMSEAKPVAKMMLSKAVIRMQLNDEGLVEQVFPLDGVEYSLTVSGSNESLHAIWTENAQLYISPEKIESLPIEAVASGEIQIVDGSYILGNLPEHFSLFLPETGQKFQAVNGILEISTVALNGKGVQKAWIEIAKGHRLQVPQVSNNPTL